MKRWEGPHNEVGIPTTTKYRSTTLRIEHPYNVSCVSLTTRDLGTLCHDGDTPLFVLSSHFSCREGKIPSGTFDTWSEDECLVSDFGRTPESTDVISNPTQ